MNRIECACGYRGLANDGERVGQQVCPTCGDDHGQKDLRAQPAAVQPTPIPHATCADCLYWCERDQIKTGAGPVLVGECRRLAPRPSQYGEWSWPPVREHDWCGEYAPRAMSARPADLAAGAVTQESGPAVR
ncbi:MAG: hypothetical protein HS116_18295 [Planctomycetes bacterium]|nr:hypothetical protein [Planctomycetota bacterium]